jgi:hypothetical protein
MYLVQILLPLYENSGRRVPRKVFRAAAKRLAAEFGGVTAYTRAPAEGLWRRTSNKLDRDDIIVFEVMSDRANKAYWRAAQRELRQEFVQDEILVRSIRTRRL